jgi:hypothetical protein
MSLSFFPFSRVRAITNCDDTRDPPPALSKSGDAWKTLHTFVGERAKIFIWEKDTTGFAVKTKTEINACLNQIAIVEAVELRRQQGDTSDYGVMSDHLYLLYCPLAPSILILVDKISRKSAVRASVK